MLASILIDSKQGITTIFLKKTKKNKKNKTKQKTPKTLYSSIQAR